MQKHFSGSGLLKDHDSITIGEVSTVTTGKGLKREEFIENGEYPVLGANGEIGRTNKYLCDEELMLTGRVEH